MKNNMKTILWVVIILIVIVITSISINSKPETGSRLLIGADFLLTGNGSEYGEWARKGSEIAVEQINASGGVLGYPIKVIYEDFAGDTAKAVTVYNKLRDSDKVSAVLTQLSSPALAVEKYINQDKIIQMDISASSPAYSTPNDYSFRVGIVATQLAGESADILYNKLNAKRVAVLYINNDFGLGMKKAFSTSFKGSVVAEDSFAQNSSDFRTQLTKLKLIDSNIDYILLVGHGKESGLLVKQARDIGIKTKFFSDTYSVESPEFISAAGQAGDGLIFVVSKFDSKSSDLAVRNFTDLFVKKYNTEPVAYAAQAYDAVIALAKSYKSCTKLNNDCTKAQLMKLDYMGASGKIKFDINGDVIKSVGLKQVKDGKFVSL